MPTAFVGREDLLQTEEAHETNAPPEVKFEQYQSADADAEETKRVWLNGADIHNAAELIRTAFGKRSLQRSLSRDHFPRDHFPTHVDQPAHFPTHVDQPEIIELSAATKKN